MLRRLFFLFPDEPHAQHAVNQLISLDIPMRRIHTIAKNIELKSLPQATKRQQNDTSLTVMAATFIVGEQFAVHVPDAHLSEFTEMSTNWRLK